MPTKIVVPELGESIIEATVGRWLKQEGDHVQVGEPLLELETEKVNLEVGAEHAGVLISIERQEGEDVEVGEVLALLEEDGAETDGAAKETTEAGEGSQAEASPEPADEDEPEATEAKAAQEVGEADAKSPDRGGAEAEARATPSARRLAREKGLDLTEVSAELSTSRLTRANLERYLQQQAPEAEESKAAQAPASPKAESKEPEARRKPTKPDVQRRETRERLSRRRQTIARRLVEAQRTAAMLTTFNEVDMSAVMSLRHRRNDSFQEQHGVKLGISSFFVKACIGALKDFPRLNAELEDDEVLLKHYYDIGIAIGAEEGLVVPVLRDADRMSFATIEHTIKDYARQAQEGTLSLEDLRGGSFTITNGGVFGSLLSTPILNPPQVGILGLHKIEERPIVQQNEIVICPMMYVALSYDHRIVDGREAVQFLVRIKTLIEDPETLLLEG